MTKTTELNKDMIDLINYHLKDNSKDTISCYEMWDHETALFYKDGVLDSMISYFFLDFNFDMMIVMQRDNKFNKTLWRILRDTTQNRVKPIRIASDPTNKALVKKTKQYGAVWHEDEQWYY